MDVTVCQALLGSGMSPVLDELAILGVRVVPDRKGSADVECLGDAECSADWIYLASAIGGVVGAEAVGA